MPTGPNTSPPDYSPWIVTGVLLFAGLAYATYRHPALVPSLTVAMAGVGLLIVLVRK